MITTCYVIFILYGKWKNGILMQMSSKLWCIIVASSMLPSFHSCDVLGCKGMKNHPLD